MIKKDNTLLDHPKTTLERAKIIKQKALLKSIYLNFYQSFKELLKNLPPGKKVEIGSGGGFIKELLPEVITSDIIKLPHCNLTFSAEKMPFANNQLSAIFMLNVFHHIKKPEKALSEFSRCLKKGGKVLMIEPYNSVWARFFYQNFHHETFNPKAGWHIQKGGSLSEANGALPWIVFCRDSEKFARLYPKLKITKVKPHTPLRYLLSGGFSGPQLIPAFLIPMINSLESKLEPINNHVAMFVTIELDKI